MKGGDDSFVGDMFAAGIGAYAAKNSTSMGGLLWTLAKYALVIIVAMFVLGAIVRVFTRAHFVPTGPYKEGDEKVMTPAGNVIMY